MRWSDVWLAGLGGMGWDSHGAMAARRFQVEIEFVAATTTFAESKADR
jgi:hypothetical protein